MKKTIYERPEVEFGELNGLGMLCVSGDDFTTSIGGSSDPIYDVDITGSWE